MNKPTEKWPPHITENGEVYKILMQIQKTREKQSFNNQETYNYGQDANRFIWDIIVYLLGFPESYSYVYLVKKL